MWIKNRKVKIMEFNVDDLPVEMVEAILCNVASSDLIICRQVNHKWNQISSQIIRQRADIQIAFSFERGQVMRSIQSYSEDSLLGRYPITRESSMSLSDLIGCLEQSQYFPFSNFRFKDLGTNGTDCFERFLSIWGTNIYVLAVKIGYGSDATNNVEMLRALLLEKTPHLKKLGIEFDLFFDENRQTPVHLFTASNKFELPELNVLRVHCAFEKFSGIVEDILEATPNLKLFEKCSLNNGRMSQYVTAKELTILRSLDKLHCLKSLNLMFKEDVITCLEESPQIMDHQFKSIELPVDWLEQGDQQLTQRATKLINKIFDSSKNSLQMLDIPPLGWLSGLILPKFENLQVLVLTHDEDRRDNDEVYCMFPSLFDMTENFPNLERLTAYFFGEDEYFSTNEPANVLPKVEFLQIFFDDRYNEKLMKMTPNVTTLLISNDSDCSPSMDFHEISIYLPKLKNLGWEIYGKSQHDLQSSCDLDALITGYSKTFCKVKSTEFRDKDRLSKREVASYEPYRRYTSLVDLKELRRFEMSLTLDHNSYKNCDCEKWNSDCSENERDDGAKNYDNAGFNQYSDWYRSSLTKVSQFLAFDLLPYLETDIRFTFTG